MNRFLKFIITNSIILLTLQGCATHAKFVKKHNAWIGQKFSHIMKDIGYPDSTFTLANKNRVYVYERSRIYTLPSPMLSFGFGGPFGNYGLFGYDNEIIQESCKLFIETDKRDTIIKWGSRGNHCVSN
jgi:hypothetical protein